jgi:hypothetical protein
MYFDVALQQGTSARIFDWVDAGTMHGRNALVQRLAATDTDRCAAKRLFSRKFEIRVEPGGAMFRASRMASRRRR